MKLSGHSFSLYRLIDKWLQTDREIHISTGNSCMNCQGALRSHVRACLSVKFMLIVFLPHTKHMRLHRSRCSYVHLSLKSEMAIALIHMARGSPWVVLSCEGMTSPSMKRGALLQYVLTTIFAKGGQRLCMFFIAASLFRKLKSLLASIWAVQLLSGRPLVCLS